MKKVAILGSTGSVGRQTLEVVRELGFKVVALSAGKNIYLLEQQLREFRPSLVAVQDGPLAKELAHRVQDTGVSVLSGEEGLCEVATWPSASLVVNAVVGFAGLRPTLAALASGKDVALANKETLVAGGELVMDLARRKGTKILPVDSEHSAIFQCFLAGKREELEKVVLTASGGPFFGRNRDFLKTVTAEDALKHPTWQMGPKISIDSATMMNKGLEIIEAARLFSLSDEEIEVAVHPESIVHSLVQFRDGATMAQLGAPDMRLPIQFALTYPDRTGSQVPRLNVTKMGKLSFFEPDFETFHALELCKEALRHGATYPALLNSANEAAVEMFLRKEISFLEITDVVERAMDAHKPRTVATFEEIFTADQEGREFVRKNAHMR